MAIKIELDHHPLARAGSATIYAVSLMHLAQMFMLLQSAGAGNATCLVMLLRVFGHNLDAAAVVVAMAALIALVGTTFHIGRMRLLLLIPQHFFLGVMMLGGAVAAWHGAYLDGTHTYPDGTPIPWQHIATDQAPLIVLFIAHSNAILRRAWDPDD